MRARIKSLGLFGIFAVFGGLLVGAGGLAALIYFQTQHAPIGMPLFAMGASVPSYMILLYTFWYLDKESGFETAEIWLIKWCGRISKTVFIGLSVFVIYYLYSMAKTSWREPTEKDLLYIIISLLILSLYVRKR